MTIEEWKLWAEQLRKQEKAELVEYLETIKNNEDKLKEITVIEIDNYEGLYYLSDKPLLQQEILSEVLKKVLQGDINDWDMEADVRNISIDPARWEGVENITLYFQSQKLNGVNCDGKPYALLLQAIRLDSDNEEE